MKVNYRENNESMWLYISYSVHMVFGKRSVSPNPCFEIADNICLDTEYKIFTVSVKIIGVLSLSSCLYLQATLVYPLKGKEREGQWGTWVTMPSKETIVEKHVMLSLPYSTIVPQCHELHSRMKSKCDQRISHHKAKKMSRFHTCLKTEPHLFFSTGILNSGKETPGTKYWVH